MSHEMLVMPTFASKENIVSGALLIVKAFVALEAIHKVFQHLVFGYESKRLAKAAEEYNKKQQVQNKYDRKKHDVAPQDTDNYSSEQQPTVCEALVIQPVPKDQLAKTAAQYAHFVANSTLALTGIYYWFLTGMPALADTTLDERLAGYDECSIFGCGLVAYNFWSTYVALTVWGEEELVMAIHHTCASTVGFIVAFTTHGWRYYAPFFFGVVELSSLPLSIMNIYKHRPDWRITMTGLHGIVKILFAVCFLAIRVGFWLPNISWYLRDCFDIIFSTDPAMTLAFRFVVLMTSAVPGLFLTGLQLFWGYRIAFIVVQILIGSPKTAKKA